MTLNTNARSMVIDIFKWINTLICYISEVIAIFMTLFQ